MTKEQKTKLGLKLYELFHPRGNYFSSKRQYEFEKAAVQFYNFIKEEKNETRSN